MVASQSERCSFLSTALARLSLTRAPHSILVPQLNAAVMATPHRSRYSRPLKATLPYSGSSAGCSSSSSSKGTPATVLVGSPTGPAVGGTQGRRGSGERRGSPERQSPVTTMGKGQGRSHNVVGRAYLKG